MIKAAFFILLSLVALTFKLSEPAFYFSGNILEAINYPGTTWGKSVFKDSFNFDDFYSLYNVPSNFLLYLKEEIDTFSLVFIFFTTIFLSSFFYFFFSNKGSRNSSASLITALIYIFLLNLSFENPLKLLAAIFFPWTFYFLEQSREKKSNLLCLFFTAFLLFCFFIDFSFVILSIYFLLSETILFALKKERLKSLYPLISVFLFCLALSIYTKTNLIFQKISLFLTSQKAFTLNYYSFQSPNFHLDHSLPITLCVLLGLKALLGTSLEKKTRIRLTLAFIFAALIKGAEFIFVFLVAKIVYDELSKVKFKPKIAFCSAAIISFIFLSSFSINKKINSNKKPKLSSNMKKSLKELSKVENVKILNSPSLALILRKNSLKPFIDERMGAGYKEYKELIKSPEKHFKILNQINPSHILIKKESSLNSFLLESKKWRVISESKEHEKKKMEFLSKMLDNDIILLKRVI